MHCKSNNTNMRIGNLRKTTGFWKSLFFMGNVCKMRQKLISYLLEEGISAKVEDGQIIFKYNESLFVVDFEMNEHYSECIINFKCEDDEYESLSMSDKTYIADKVNTDKENHATVYTFDDSFNISTSFYFSNKQMMLDLFRTHLMEMTESVDMAIDIVSDKIEQRKNRNRRIGFYTQDSFENCAESETSKIVATLKQ